MDKVNTEYFWISQMAISTQRYFETFVNILIDILGILGKVFVSSDYSGATHFARITLNFTMGIIPNKNIF